MKKNIISKKAEKLINDFDVACQNYGWQMDQGHKKTYIDNAIEEYDRAERAIVKYILKLEKKEKNV